MLTLPKAARMAATTSALAFGALAGAAQAQDYGTYALNTLETLVFDFPGRYSGTTAFAGASDWMASRFTLPGSSLTRQDFTTRAGRASQNVIVSMQGRSDDFILVGAHFDTAVQRAGALPLQGVDDNGSGASVLTELAGHMAGLELETSLVFNAFGAEESGLEGARYYLNSLSEDETARLKGMINIDSLITGDFMYAHAGSDYLTNPELKSYWTRVHAIARELGIELKSNPGLNPDYPIDTGCCSDGAVYEGLGIPVLWLESTNWELGDLDGYQQTDNPAIPGGSTWHQPAEDNWEFLEAAFGPDRIPDRLTDYSRLLTRLLVELTNADLIASAEGAGKSAFAMNDLILRDTEALQGLVERGAAWRLGNAQPVGKLGGSVAIEGLTGRAEFGNSGVTDTDSGRLALQGNYQLTETISLGADLMFTRSSDTQIADGKMDADTTALALSATYAQDALWALASLSVGETSLDGSRRLQMTSGLGASILDQTFDLKTDAHTTGLGLKGGFDIARGAISFGPVAGLSYQRIRTEGFTENGPARTAMHYEAQDFESLEAEIGLRAGSVLDLGGRALSLGGELSVVRELADGRPEGITLTDSEGGLREAAFVSADDRYGRISLGAELQVTPAASAWINVSGRIDHDQGAQTGAALGFAYRF